MRNEVPVLLNRLCALRSFSLKPIALSLNINSTINPCDQQYQLRTLELHKSTDCATSPCPGRRPANCFKASNFLTSMFICTLLFNRRAILCNGHNAVVEDGRWPLYKTCPVSVTSSTALRHHINVWCRLNNCWLILSYSVRFLFPTTSAQGYCTAYMYACTRTVLLNYSILLLCECFPL